MKNILVVEDEAISQLSIKMILEKNNFNVLTAGTGIDALNICDSNNVDTIIMDIGLPDMNGLDVAKQIKTNKNIPILILSGYKPTEINAININAYLQKPIKNKILLEKINCLLDEITIM